jgi:hypothetical protein
LIDSFDWVDVYILACATENCHDVPQEQLSVSFHILETVSLLQWDARPNRDLRNEKPSEVELLVCAVRITHPRKRSEVLVCCEVVQEAVGQGL